jgi:hypothetical protein
MCPERSFVEIDAERVDELGFLDIARSPRVHGYDDLLAGPIAWILGRPWIGKSTVAHTIWNRLQAEHKMTFGLERRVTLTRLNSAEGGRTVPPSWWETWKTESHPTPAVWLIDGVDEVIDNNRHLLDTIASIVEGTSDGHLRQLRLLLFSRPYAELECLQNRLKSRYAAFTHRTRLPQFWLTRLDRAAAAELVGSERFMAVEDTIRRNQLQSVAGYPVVLNFLKTYRRDTDTLTVPKVWRGVLTALVGESRSNRMVQFETTSEERFDAACRVAAVLTLTRRETIREWSLVPEEPTIGSLFSSPSNRSYCAALDACRTALFSPTGDPIEYRFVQRNAQDWLTAFAIAGLPLQTLRSALATTDGSLAPRLMEIARLLGVVTSDQSVHAMIDELSGGSVLPSDAVEPSLAEVLRSLSHLEALAESSPWGLRVGFDNPEDLARLRVEGLGSILAQRLRDSERV